MCRPLITACCSGGTAFITDVGMTGDYDSVIGMNKAEPLHRFVRRIPSGKFEPALGPATFARGCAVETTMRRDSRPASRRCGSAGSSRRSAAGVLGK